MVSLVIFLFILRIYFLKLVILKHRTVLLADLTMRTMVCINAVLGFVQRKYKYIDFSLFICLPFTCSLSLKFTGITSIISLLC